MQTIQHQPLTTRVKAKNLNEDRTIYGTFAEIGAGQEVASAFFKVGGASKTVAKTMSAYDMTFSDTIYGKEKSGRYVVENRLNKMLDREFGLLEERIGEQMCERRFFVFANTMATKSPKNGRPGHGWLGCKFQLEPQGPVHKIILHVHLYESMIESQQNLIGVLGVNLLYAAYRYSADLPLLLESLKDGLMGRKFDIDVIKVTGKSFEDVDNRALNLKLISQGLAEAILFDEKGQIQTVTDKFYNQALLVARGRFRPPTLQTKDMLCQGVKQLQEQAKGWVVLPLCEITFNNIFNQEKANEEDLIFRLEMISAMNMQTMITNFEYHYRLSEYLNMFANSHIAFVLGIDNLTELFREEHYKDLPGGTLEAIGRLFKNKFQLYLYPKVGDGGKLVKGEDIQFPQHIQYLFLNLWCQGLIKDFHNYDPDVLNIHSKTVLSKIRDKDESWEALVPPEISSKIKVFVDLIDRRLEEDNA
ncbi:hypothetical protein SAMN06296036_13421 [Pseudobacteriovorax antillogorgiicola]|uniref:Nicotinate-nucleotide adenylyltransferase n=2 Tax=Pseudobacteriovorax antillogorgiicola TaxID=1513793 RepID=A0A1Y6CUA5_9BACT|nr:hypothetical protein EDD56_13532 [Pseudobacteriovorax antillogorgiicola]SMF79961.1 hypothetical protein SAMN06296036_13421 [Pseudobacteriovorax antillogorgiicola]